MFLEWKGIGEERDGHPEHCLWKLCAATRGSVWRVCQIHCFWSFTIESCKVSLKSYCHQGGTLYKQDWFSLYLEETEGEFDVAAAATHH